MPKKFSERVDPGPLAVGRSDGDIARSFVAGAAREAAEERTRRGAARTVTAVAILLCLTAGVCSALLFPEWLPWQSGPPPVAEPPNGAGVSATLTVPRPEPSASPASASPTPATLEEPRGFAVQPLAPDATNLANVPPPAKEPAEALPSADLPSPTAVPPPPRELAAPWTGALPPAETGAAPRPARRHHVAGNEARASHRRAPKPREDTPDTAQVGTGGGPPIDAGDLPPLGASPEGNQ